MDLRLYLRVIWRFRVIVGLGLVLACALSFFSYAKLTFKGGSPKVSYRQAQTWEATSLVFLTQKGFPYGYTVLPYALSGQQTKGSTPNYVPKYAAPGTFTQLAFYYAPFVQSDGFHALLRQRTHAPGVVQAHTIIDPTLRQAIPYIDILGFSSTAAGAVDLANAGGQALAPVHRRPAERERRSAEAARRRADRVDRAERVDLDRTQEDDADRRLPDRAPRRDRALVRSREPSPADPRARDGSRAAAAGGSCGAPTGLMRSPRTLRGASAC